VVADAYEDEEQTEAIEKGASSEDNARLAEKQVLFEHVGHLEELEELEKLALPEL
jgi:hypothetical protein